MRRAVWLLALLWPWSASAVTGHFGDVAVIEDVTGAIHDQEGFWGPDQLCRETAKIFYLCHADAYDGFVVFTTQDLDMLHNVQQGTPVKVDFDGVGYTKYDWTGKYGSAGRLSQCVSMTSIDGLPDDPDAEYKGGFFGLGFGVTGIELLGHEYGHHWLMGAEYDLGLGDGPQTDLRGYENDSANLHYSAKTNSHSVMYGNFITDNGDGTFESCGGDRKYNELDQYLMGLRSPDEVSPIFLVSDGTGEGDPAVGTPKGKCNTIEGTRVDVTVDDVIRALGPRVPAAAEAPHAWHVGFILVSPAGTSPTAAQIQKVDAYRRRWEAFFSWATDGRGTMTTELTPNLCVGGDTDGGTPDAGPADAGPIDAGPVDAGPQDAGLVDAGTPDAGPVDAGLPDAGAAADAGDAYCQIFGCDAGSPDGGADIDTIGTVGCDCDTTGGPAALWPLALVAVAALRRRRASK